MSFGFLKTIIVSDISNQSKGGFSVLMPKVWSDWLFLCILIYSMFKKELSP